MDQAYRDTTTEMEKMGVSEDYIIGWQGGYLGHPEREEQLLTEAYEAGREDGQNKVVDNFKDWVN
ncbi:MAG: hypothetical protein HKN34_08145 [Gammaproteobacteria bacterium]|nr:hypothetical protein [Gammaproteobacteria bacterium]